MKGRRQSGNYGVTKGRSNGVRAGTPWTRFSKTSTRYRVPGAGHRIRCPTFGPRPSTWTKHAARPYLPRPSSLHGRGPDPEPRGPNRETRPWGLHTRCAHFPVAGLGLRCSVFGPRRRSGTGSRVPGARYPGPGTRYRVLVFEKPAHGVCMMQDRAESHPAYPMGSVPGSVLGARYPAFSHRRMRDEGDTTFPCPSPPRPGRGPRTESRPPNPAPLPYCPIALLPYCPTAFPSFWTRHSLTHLQIFEIIVHYSCL